MNGTLVTTAAVAAMLFVAGGADASGQSSAPAASRRHVTKSTAKRKKPVARAPQPSGPSPVWPVPGPAPLPGAVLPHKRIVAYYGNPLSKRMGILGALPPEQMLARLDTEVEAWQRADPGTPVQPALHLIAVVAQAAAGRDGMYRARMPDTLIERVAEWASRRNALLFLDVQLGKSTVGAELPRLVPFLKRPNVHLAIDPEFAMQRSGRPPGKQIGTLDAAEVNYATALLARVVTENKLPPKILVVHRFTRDMLTGAHRIALDPRVQIVVDMDGFGSPTLKRGSYRAFVYAYPVQYTGFKLFYNPRNDHPRMTPEQILELTPAPMYIQYQ